MKFKQKKTGTILETDNAEAVALMQGSDAYEAVPDGPPKPPKSKEEK